LEDAKISTRLKIAALWASVSFCYLFGDIMSFFTPDGYIAQSMAGKIGFFKVTQSTMLVISVLNSITCVMIFVTLILKTKASRRVNIIIGSYQTIVNLLVFLTSSWAYFIYFGIVESILTGLIVWYAWKWPAAKVSLPENN